MNEIVLYSCVYLVGIIISAFSQVLLKKAAAKTANQSFLKQYLNPWVIGAYAIFFLATFFTIFAYKVIPVTLGAILGSLEYGLVVILGHFFFKEHLTAKQICGVCLIIGGIIVYSLHF